MITEQLFKNAKKKKLVGFIHKIYLSFLKNKKNYTASTKTKSEVRGGGAKPWRQKGTGKARAGSNRSPLWVGGGVIFGPKPRNVEKKINKKENRLAILSAFYLKQNNLSICNFDFAKITSIFKTKFLLKFLKENGYNSKEKNLLILSERNKLIWLMGKNLKNLTITTINTVNIEELIKAKHIFISDATFNLISKLYGEQKKQ
jgi:large subunit ribosomal protein L4